MAPSRFAAAVALIERHRAALAWLLGLGFVLASLPELAAQAPNFDEGVYIMQARMVRGGAAPYVDFFYHQTPLYLYALAGFSALGPDTLVTYRLLSLLATAVAGVVVAAAARRGVGTFAAIAVQLVFYAAPLQSFGKLALPNATMVLLSTLGIFAVVFTQDRRFTWAGAVCLALAVGVKPLAAPTVIAVVIVVALHPGLRPRLPALVLGGLLTGGASWAILHLTSGGDFTDVVLVQAGRYAKRSGFELMAHFPDFKAAMDARGATTAVAWNIAEHRTAFLDDAPLNGNLLLLLVALAAPFCGALRAPRGRALAAVAWLGVPLCFSLFVWEPSWNHYFLQYVPPMALLSGYAFDAAWRRPALQGPAALAAAIVIYAGVTHPDTDREWYEKVAAAQTRTGAEEVFTFMPLYHVVAGTRPACGLVDPINVYGEQCAVSWAPETPLYRFHVAPEDIIECLHPGVPVVIERYAFWFMDAQVIAHLAATPRRLFFLDDLDRDRFFSTARSLGAIAAPGGAP